MLTTSQQIEKRGRQLGRTEGIQQEKFFIAKSMLDDGTPVDKVSKWTRLTQADLSKLV